MFIKKYIQENFYTGKSPEVLRAQTSPPAPSPEESEDVCMTGTEFFAVNKNSFRQIIQHSFLWMLMTIVLLLSCSFSNAQYNDSVKEPPPEDTAFTSDNYDDADDYDDTDETHMYDSSEYYFDWKVYDQQHFRSDSFARKTIPDSIISKFENDDDFWYINETQDFKNMYLRLQSDPAFRDSLMKARGFDRQDKRVTVHEIGTRPEWLDTFIWILVIAIVIASVIYFLSTNKISFFSRSDKKIMGENENAEEEDFFTMKYPELIRRAVAEKNFRLAVRLHYLQTLKMMDEKKLIRYIPEHTNQHYLLQIQRTKYFDDFATVTRDYEYVWYGKFSLSEAGYQQVREDFTNLQNKVKYA